MPFLRQYHHDIFVSYSLANDAYELDNKPWVRRLVEKLTTELSNRLPGNGKAIKFYFAGKGDLKPGQQLKSCFDEAEKSALFLIIGSPRYADVWPSGELRSFVSKFGAGDRVFVAEMLPCTYPDLIGDPMRSTFHVQTDGDVAVPYETSKGPCASVIAELAAAMSSRLVALGEAQPTEGAQAAAPRPVHPPVLIAQTQMADEARRLRTHLRQFDVPIIPEDEFLEEGAEFREEFAQALSKAKIVVQLLGRYPGRRPKSLPEGYDDFQAEAARGHEGVRLLQWRDPSIDLASVEDARHRALLEGADAMLFEEFKDMVVRAATAPPPLPEPRPGGGFIFIDADSVDQQTAREVFNACRQRNLPVLMPAYGVDTRKEWRENYAGADRIAIIYGKSGFGWLTSQLRLFMKTAATRRRVQDCLIYLGPPPPKGEQDVPLYHPKFSYIDGTGGDLDKLYEQLFS